MGRASSKWPILCREERKTLINQSVTCLWLCAGESHVWFYVGQPRHLTLWVGTSSGHVFIYQLTVPDGEKRREEDVTCFLGKLLTATHLLAVWLVMLLFLQYLNLICHCNCYCIWRWLALTNVLHGIETWLVWYWKRMRWHLSGLRYEWC